MRFCTRFINGFLVKHLIILSIVLVLVLGILTSGAKLRQERTHEDFIPLQKPYSLQKSDRLIVSSTVSSVTYNAVVESVQTKAKRVGIRYDDCWVACTKLISMSSPIILHAYRLQPETKSVAQRESAVTAALESKSENEEQRDDGKKKKSSNDSSLLSPTEFASVHSVAQLERQLYRVSEKEEILQNDITSLNLVAAEQRQKHDDVCLRVSKLEVTQKKILATTSELTYPSKNESMATVLSTTCDCDAEFQATYRDIHTRFKNFSVLLSDDMQSQFDELGLQLNKSLREDKDTAQHAISNLRFEVEQILDDVNLTIKKMEKTIPNKTSSAAAAVAATKELNLQWNETLHSSLEEVIGPLEKRIENVSLLTKSNLTILKDDLTSEVKSVSDRLNDLEGDVGKLEQRLDKFGETLRTRNSESSRNESVLSSAHYALMEDRIAVWDQTVSNLKSELTQRLLNLSSKVSRAVSSMEMQEKTTSSLTGKTSQLEKDLVRIADTAATSASVNELKEMVQQQQKLLSQQKSDHSVSIEDNQFHQWAIKQDFDALNPKPDWASAIVGHSTLMTASILESLFARFYTLVRRRFSQEALRPTFRNGQCTPLQGDNGYIIVKLFRPIRVESLAIYHRDKSVLPIQGSAPHKFEVFGQAVKDSSWRQLGYFSFDKNSPKRLQFFEFQDKTVFSHVKVQFLSNWGASYICVYRIRVHGERPRR